MTTFFYYGLILVPYMAWVTYAALKKEKNSKFGAVLGFMIFLLIVLSIIASPIPFFLGLGSFGALAGFSLLGITIKRAVERKTLHRWYVSRKLQTAKQGLAAYETLLKHIEEGDEATEMARRRSKDPKLRDRYERALISFLVAEHHALTEQKWRQHAVAYWEGVLERL